MRLLVECPECRRQYDASRRKIGSRFRCNCGHVVVVERPQGHDARVVRCSACGASRTEGAAHCPYCDAQFTLIERDLNTVCPHCLARVGDRAQFCHHCGTALTPESDAGEDTHMICPACGGEQKLASRRLEHEKITVLECGQCAGFWLGHEAFRHVIEQARQEVLPAGTVLDNPQTVAAKFGLHAETEVSEPQHRNWQYRRCVVCGEFMIRRNYGHASGVIIDICRDHGIWFDADELARIIAWLHAGGAESPPAAAENSDVALKAAELIQQPPKGFFRQLLDHILCPPTFDDWP